jgi:two-component system sensor histidine kinase RegB
VPEKPAPERTLDPARHRINFSWLTRLRWGAISGQALAIGIVHLGLEIALPLGWLLSILAIEIGVNLGCVLLARARKSVSEGLLVAALAFDVIVLTALLYFTGGPFNPFGFLYLVHVALAAVVMRSVWTWALVALSLAGFGFLFLEHQPLEAPWFDHGFHDGGHVMHHDHHAGHAAHAGGATTQSMHLQGMWLGVAVAALFIVDFVSRISRDLESREVELLRARAAANRGEKLAALATLAAGAAHELATPLSTIAIAAKDLERAASDSTLADVKLIRSEVARCRAILDRMSADAGESAGEALRDTSAKSLLELALDGLPEREQVEPRGQAEAWEKPLRVPERAVASALRGILNNALLASSAGAKVTVEASAEETDAISIAVVDSGDGMKPEVLERVGEPFFTTRDPGQGMGLGVFVARSLLERLGGRLGIDSEPRSGTRVTLHVPSSTTTRLELSGSEHPARPVAGARA